ncbi:DNA photolyase, FAD-binding/Cryptochrome [Tribonema minus]|uniref:Deoxyribodipyrimidine photo-lyase n=1 Tax=Tribonema minus TaxID=303371 RepID=A0A835YLJ9_9STRA|nr:DNA photolyase, FAD-binding/Cryptochrome [Tribonema minus]
MRSASQLRSRISAAVRAHFMAPPPTLTPLVASLDVRLAAEDEEGALDVSCPEAVLAGLNVDRSVPQLSVPAAGAGVVLRGGQMEAKRLLAVFLQKGLNGFAKSRNEPFKRAQSHLSPYLHYGHISVMNIAAKVLAHKSSTPRDRTKYVDELVVFRELAINYCFNNPSYDSIDGLPKWAQDTLEAHKSDTRHTIYMPLQLERGETSDPLWNAAQHEMVVTGKMHNYLRMYWAKQLLRWMADPREAYQLAVMLNDKYSLDGRDCNGYMGIAWCFGATDRPFPESAIFGKVRQMSSRGVSARKNTARYIDQVRDACRAIACARTKALVPPAAASMAGALYPLLSAQHAPANPPTAVGRAAPPDTGTGITVKGTGAFEVPHAQPAGVATSHVGTGARGKAAARSAAKAPAKSVPQPPSKTRDLRSYFAAAAPSAAAMMQHKATDAPVSLAGESSALESESPDASDSSAQFQEPAPAAAAAAAQGKAHTVPSPGEDYIDIISDAASDGNLERDVSDLDDGASVLSDAEDKAQGGPCGESGGRPPKRLKT